MDPAKHRLAVKGLVSKEVSFSIDELKKNFPAVRTQAMLECAGSGRTGFLPRPSGTLIDSRYWVSERPSTPSSVRSAEKPKFTEPLRPGRPPGHRTKGQDEADIILQECHALVQDRARADSS